ncbi:glycosyltransferase family 25 protein [Psychrobacter celer]|uniref:glycosyltransferase family 25 protein n=1 Tax=Psychrobacter celer TaxID=306572 RepID=UPI003FD54A1D
MKKIPIFVINLPQSTDRKAYIKAQCESMGISPVFIDAVNGKELSKSDIERYVDQNRVKKLFGRELLLGEIGCALSHKKIYQKMVDENIPYAVILEDDATLEKDLPIVVKKILTAPLSWELILLGHYKSNLKGFKSPISLWHRQRISSKFLLGRLVDFGFGTHGYMITLKGAKKILSELKYIYKPIDHYTPDSNILNVYALYPTVINVQNSFDTLIDENRARSNKDRLSVVLLKKVGIINAAISVKNFIKTLKPIKKYK